MLGLILDTLILMGLIRFITGDEQDGFGKPAIIALLAGVSLMAASIGAAGAGAAALWILLGAVLGVGVLVALGCFALLNVEPSKSAIIGCAFAGYKIAFSIFVALVFAAAG